MKIKFCGLTITRHHSPAPVPATPQVLMDERQQILEAQRKLNEERVRQINQLKATAKQSFENTCTAIEITSKQDLKSIIELNKIIKQKESEEQEYKSKIEQIESLLSRIADGEMVLIDTLLNNELFLDLFPDFDFEEFAAEVGNVELFERVSTDAFKKAFLAISEARIVKKRKEAEERINSNLAPQFVDIANRPIQERVSALYAYYMYRNIESGQSSKENWDFPVIKIILSNIKSYKNPLETKNEAERAFLDYDNLSRITQVVMNQYLGDKLPDPTKEGAELVKAYSLALVALVFAQRLTDFFDSPMSVDGNNNKQNKSMLFLRYMNQQKLYIYFKSILFAGIVRMLHEKGNYGDNIQSLVSDARAKFFDPFIESVENVFKLATVPIQLKDEIFKIGFKDLLFVKMTWIAILNQYSEITTSGQYPVADARIFAEAQERAEVTKKSYITKNRVRDRSHREIRVGMIFYYLCSMQGLSKELDQFSLKKALHDFKSKKIDLKLRLESLNISSDVEEILLQVKYYYDLDFKCLDKALAVASIAILGPYNPNLMDSEIQNILFASLTAGLMRSLVRLNPQEEDLVLFKKSNEIILPFIYKFYDLYQFSRLSAQERRDKKQQEFYKLNSTSVEIADLMSAYEQVLNKKEYEMADPMLLFKAEELRKRIDKIESSYFANTSLRDFPHVTVSRTHTLSFADKLKGWLGTPDHLTAEAQSSESPYLKNRTDFSQRLNTNLKPELKEAIEMQNLLKSNLSLSPNVQLQKDQPYSADLPGLGLTFNSGEQIRFKHSGVNILELRPRVYDGQTLLLSKAVYICNKPFIKSNLSNYYLCGKQKLEFIEPISGTFTIQYLDFDNKQIGKPASYRFNNQSEIDFNIEQPGGFEFTVQLQENESFIHSHRAEAYQKSKFDWAHPILSARHREGALDFSLNNETFVRFHNNGAVELPKNSSQQEPSQVHRPEINALYQQKLNALKNQLRGSSNDIILKILLIAKRLLPESLMFAPFLAIAKALENFDSPEAIEKLAALLCKQFALHEVRKKFGLKAAEQYLLTQEMNNPTNGSRRENIFPANWSAIFNLAHSSSEEERLKGLFLQLLQVNGQFFSVTCDTIKIDQVFKLTQELFKLASPEGLKVLNEEINNELKPELNYLRLVTEINSVLGPDKNYQRTLHDHFKNIGDEHAELHYYNQSALGDALARGRYDNFNQMTNIENDCLKNMSHIQSEMDRINSEYNASSKILQDLLEQNTRVINQYRYQQEQIRNAIKKAKQKQKMKMLQGIGVTLLAAFTAGALAPCAASFMGISNTLVIKGMESLMATAFRAGLGVKPTIKNAAFSALVPFLDSSALAFAESLKLTGASAQLFTAGVRNLAATSLNGGNMAKNFLLESMFSGPTDFLEGGNMVLKAAFTTGQIVTKAAATTALYKTNFGMNLLNGIVANAAVMAAAQGANLAKLGLEAYKSNNYVQLPANGQSKKSKQQNTRYYKRYPNPRNPNAQGLSRDQVSRESIKEHRIQNKPKPSIQGNTRNSGKGNLQGKGKGIIQRKNSAIPNKKGVSSKKLGYGNPSEKLLQNLADDHFDDFMEPTNAKPVALQRSTVENTRAHDSPTVDHNIFYRTASCIFNTIFPTAEASEMPHIQGSSKKEQDPSISPTLNERREHRYYSRKQPKYEPNKRNDAHLGDQSLPELFSNKLMHYTVAIQQWGTPFSDPKPYRSPTERFFKALYPCSDLEAGTLDHYIEERSPVIFSQVNRYNRGNSNFADSMNFRSVGAGSVGNNSYSDKNSKTPIYQVNNINFNLQDDNQSLSSRFHLLKIQDINLRDFLVATGGLALGGLVGTGIAKTLPIISKIPGGSIFLRFTGWTIAIGEIVLPTMSEFEKSSFSLSEEYRDAMLISAGTDVQKQNFSENIRRMERETTTKLKENFNLKQGLKESPFSFGLNIGLAGSMLPPIMKGTGAFVRAWKPSQTLDRQYLPTNYTAELAARIEGLTNDWIVDAHIIKNIEPSSTTIPLPQFRSSIIKQYEVHRSGQIINTKFGNVDLTADGVRSFMEYNKVRLHDKLQSKIHRTKNPLPGFLHTKVGIDSATEIVENTLNHVSIVTPGHMAKRGTRHNVVDIYSQLTEHTVRLHDNVDLGYSFETLIPKKSGPVKAEYYLNMSNDVIRTRLGN